MAASTSTQPPILASRSRLLFHRPQGTPYDFWIQPSLTKILRDTLIRDITENGGRICEPSEWPLHGFMLIDPYDPNILHQVKASFHKPVPAASTTFALRSNAPATPLRHVLSYQFVAAVIAQGEWGRYDLMRWGWPVFFNSEDMDNMEEALTKYRKEIHKNIDKELERGWVWATRTAFYSADVNHSYKDELEELDRFLTGNEDDRKRKWLRGRVVAHFRREHQTKFYLHDDIEEPLKRTIVKAILEDGGACCYDATHADVILVGCTPEDIVDDLEIVRWLEQEPPCAPEATEPKLIKFVSWVYACTKEGSPTKVNPTLHDVATSYQLYKTATSSAKGKQRISEAAEPAPLAKKRKISPIEASTPINLESSPFKKRKVQPVANEFNGLMEASTVQTQRTYVSKSNGSSRLPGSASTVRPTRVFQGVVVPPRVEPSPLARVTKPTRSSYIIPRQEFASETEEDELDEEDALDIPHNDPLNVHRSPIGFISNLKPRISASSVLTVDTASSKLDNTLATTITNNTTNTARSVGPAPPPNAKQVARMSNSTGSTGPSAASQSALDHSIVSRASGGMARTNSLRDLNIDEDDLQGEKILEGFEPSHVPEDAIRLPPPKGDDERASPLSPGEKRILVLYRKMKEWNDVGGLGIFKTLEEGWPLREKELQDEREPEKEMHRDRKGKGRVSFHEPIDDRSDSHNGAENQQEAPTSSLLHGMTNPRHIVGTPPSRVAELPEPSPEILRVAGIGKQDGKDHTGKKQEVETKVSNAPAEQLEEERNREQDQEQEIDELEEDDIVAPLPDPPKPPKKTRKKRGASVVSGDESASEVFLPRRGRSASLPPAEPAPSAPRSVKKPSQRTTARKTTGQSKQLKRK